LDDDDEEIDRLLELFDVATISYFTSAYLDDCTDATKADRIRVDSSFMVGDLQVYRLKSGVTANHQP
jgi:hypothetical protein